MLDYYPPIKPYNTGYLPVVEGHEIYFEEVGNPNGRPALFVHGGPGGATGEDDRRFHDPQAYRLILFHQRGCGKSRPFASLDDNTTWHLVDDMERLRKHLNIDRWQLFGGSWGSTLALAYAAAHIEHVSEFILRGIFLGRQTELDWLYRQGASEIFPEAWGTFANAVPEEERGELIAAYHRRLTSDDPRVRTTAARIWAGWEARLLCLHPDAHRVAAFEDEHFSDAIARIECHYFMHQLFFGNDGWLLQQAPRLGAIPTVIVQGRYDVVTPVTSAWALHRAMPESELKIVPDAGHASSEPGSKHELISAMNRFCRGH